jgi:hypothetical protein
LRESAELVEMEETVVPVGPVVPAVRVMVWSLGTAVVTAVLVVAEVEMEEEVVPAEQVEMDLLQGKVDKEVPEVITVYIVTTKNTVPVLEKAHMEKMAYLGQMEMILVIN